MTTCRFAPSPTGFLHVGNLRTALFNFLFARKSGGCFILRLDDTDPERSRDEFADAIRFDLEWLGLEWDRLERQSARLDRYRSARDDLLASGRLYECFETQAELDLKRKKQRRLGRPPVYDRSALQLSETERQDLRASRPPHFRFLLHRHRAAWQDGILGETSIDVGSVSDPVLVRADGQFLYTLASVCDDIDFGVTDVVRGADHVTNTAIQVQIFEAMGGGVPGFAHHSLLTGRGGEALAKREGSLAIRDLRAAGVEPMALLSHLARLGSSHPVVLRGSVTELAAEFDLSRFGAAPAKFDPEDAAGLTARYLATLPVSAVSSDLAALGVPSAEAGAFWGAVRENIRTRSDIDHWWKFCTGGAEPLVDSEDAGFVAEALDLLPPRPWNSGTWSSWTSRVSEATGRRGRRLYLPLRKALTGRPQGPDMSKLMPLIRAAPEWPERRQASP